MAMTSATTADTPARSSHGSVRRTTMWVPRRKRTLYLLQAADPSTNLPLAALGKYMEMSGLAPDLVILAGDAAAHHTWSALEAAFSDMPRLWMEPRFDDLPFDEQLDILRAAPAEAERILLIACSPSIPQLAAALARGYGPARTRMTRPPMLRDFPNGALAVVTLALHRWNGLAPNTGLMKAFVRPEDLAPHGP